MYTSCFRRVMLVTFSLLALVYPCSAMWAPDENTDELIQRLGHDEFREREDAHNELLNRFKDGTAEEQLEIKSKLEEARKENPDAEIRERANFALYIIAGNLDQYYKISIESDVKRDSGEITLCIGLGYEDPPPGADEECKITIDVDNDPTSPTPTTISEVLQTLATLINDFSHDPDCDAVAAELRAENLLSLKPEIGWITHIRLENKAAILWDTSVLEIFKDDSISRYVYELERDVTTPCAEDGVVTLTINNKSATASAAEPNGDAREIEDILDDLLEQIKTGKEFADLRDDGLTATRVANKIIIVAPFNLTILHDDAPGEELTGRIPDPCIDSSGFAEWLEQPQLELAVTPEVVQAGDTLTFSAFFGIPSTPCLLAIVEVAGIPAFMPVLIDAFGPDQVWSLAAPVPPGLGGVTVSFASFGLTPLGRVDESNHEIVTFQ